MKTLEDHIKELKKELKDGKVVLLDQSDEWSDGIQHRHEWDKTQRLIYIRASRERGLEDAGDLTIEQVQKYIEDIARQRMSKHLEQNSISDFLNS
ncbi:hypothetical protein [Paenibacillus crassostreae]|uniref:Uncharacterized protein n=1 Tax=Paenibacillus crassostreae TaxID=1763538 RepID=A0A167EK81_9BACL|nr:hypothetical protein [Paenibacillus crassostreae]AOZ94941.1 hypothetical protein LPB68_22035 [Paenibacillus crassostreae]OAB75624.1 hypothetical protein PNBC_08325 [Paenibacillus crassostreae]